MQGYFDARATCIQRHFRGFWSRKYVHSFYERQAYLAAVARKSAEVKALCQREYESALRWVGGIVALFQSESNGGAGQTCESALRWVAGFVDLVLRSSNGGAGQKGQAQQFPPDSTR